MLGRELVGYRTSAGRVVAMEARCSHLAANLGLGRVVGDNLRCPFHHWQYAPDGRCRHIPGLAEIPATARQAVYPVAERHGYVFVFYGSEALFPLPFFVGEEPGAFVAGRPFRFVAECSWYMLTANGFDLGHFRAVHDRQIVTPGVVDCPAPFARRMRYTARVVGHSLHDRLLRAFAGEMVDVSITSWGGPYILVTGFFRRVRSYILITARPLDEQTTQVEVIVLVRRIGHRIAAALVQPLVLGIRRWFAQGFMQDDIARLGGVRYNPRGLVATDREVIEYFRWQAALPQGAEPATPAPAQCAAAAVARPVLFQSGAPSSETPIRNRIPR